jgi:serpin B
MPTAFIDGQADFTKLNAVPGTFIDFVLHKTHIEVDEKGTKAAAVTVVGLADECEPETRTVTLDRPFLFMILDNNTNLPVFIGCVYDPTAQ